MMQEAGLRVSLVKLPVTDLETSAAYYRDVLGFREEFTVVEYGWSSMSAGDVDLALYVPGMGGGEQTPGGSAGFQLQVDDLGGLHDRLVARGALIPEGVYESDDGLRCLQISDPDGNLLHFSQRRIQ